VCLRGKWTSPTGPNRSPCALVVKSPRDVISSSEARDQIGLFLFLAFYIIMLAVTMTGKKFRVAIASLLRSFLAMTDSTTRRAHVCHCLSKYSDIEINIYEAATQFAELGAGVGIWPQPWRVMETLGLAHDLLETTQVKPRKGPGMSATESSSSSIHPSSPDIQLQKE
jgi:hypothetical protein